MSTPEIGNYVLATKYHDGDPGDRWAVGFYAGMQNERHMVKDSAGKQIHVGGYRGVIRIPFEVGNWLLANARTLERSPPGAVNLLQMVDTEFNRTMIAEESLTGEPATSQQPAELPWSDLKVEFDCGDPKVLWAYHDTKQLRLPAGWRLSETSSAFGRDVAIFRVEGVPTVADGDAVAAAIERIKS